ncbi:trigger factor [Marivirga tractuosa]|uniref:Trigger factor n=1 Tax=Marivirga tractuosa (strain ATCC 23168 / DSM 4126 / NBRC 15989 / NCIMB 1408 / VKM B-1430 / H-43) TaxID=643867 RepID=E4TVL9_MARTH|nr:trigger factor [Marivirga tractuosa]ADR21132.1 trigger factor [Marivirga tractuosa DSM 4126]BDD14413.1 trigger factor [Marivirga tractuosa]
MDITLNKKDNTNASIKIILNEADYQPNVEQKIKEYRKNANIKGFRPGKVPASYIKKLYGKSVLVEEINSLLSKSLTDYIKENDLRILGEPIPNQEDAAKIDWDNQKDFEFEYTLGLVDEFKIPLDDKFKVEKHSIEVTDKVMKETMDNLTKQHGDTESVEESKSEDTLEGKLSTADGEVQEKVVLPIEDAEKKAQKQFVGVKKGDEVKFDIEKTFKSAEAKSRLLGQNETDAEAASGEYILSVSDIKRTKPAEINQELFDKVFGKDAVKTREEFEKKVKETIAENYDRETENLLNRDLVDSLVDKTKFDLPDEFLKNWLLLSNEGKVTQEQIDKEYDLYTKDLRWNLIKNKIADANQDDIKVEHTDVMDYTKKMIAEQFGAYGMADQLGENMDSFAQNYLQGENGENYRKVYEEMLNKRVLDFIKDKITIKEKKVDLDGFKKAVDKN